MKIVDVTPYVLEAPLSRPFGVSQGWFNKRVAVVVKVVTDAGIVGWGETGFPDAAPIIRNRLAPLLIGENPLERERIWWRLFGPMFNQNEFFGLGMCALSAVDIALWDIAGKALGLPVAALLGGRLRERVPVYATGLYYTEGDFPHGLAEEAASYVEQGFRAVKMKIGQRSIEEDVRRVALVRETIGENVQLMVDANQAYTPFAAAQVAKRLEPYNVLWFEEPVPAHDVDAYVALRRRTSMALAGGENLHTRFAFREPLRRRAFDIAQPDVVAVGGITEMQKVVAMAAAFDVLVAPHAWGTPIMMAATLHVAATLPPCPRVAQPLLFLQEPLVEYDRSPNPLREALCGGEFPVRDGCVEIPTSPGLGIEVDEKALKHFHIG